MTAETPTPLTDALIEQLNIEPWLSLSTKCAELEAHARQRERRCAELERENAEVMLSDQGRLRSKLASYENQIAELRRDRERLDLVLKLLRFGGTEALRKRIHWGYPGPYREDIDAAMRDSQNGNEEGV